MARFTMQLPSASTAKVAYLPVFGRARFAGAYCVVSGDPGAEATITISDGTTTVGTITIANGSAAGDVDTAVVATAAVSTALTTSKPLKIASDGSQTNAVSFDLLIDIDEFARTS